MSGSLLRLIDARLTPKAYCQAVPSIDGSNCKGEVDQFLFGEVRGNTFIEVIGNVIVGNQGESLGPFQSCTFPLTVERRFSPGRKQIEALFTLSSSTSIFRVHINTKGTTVNLRGA